MSTVFVSYSHIDASTADEIASVLSKLGIEYFRDVKDINWGHSITAQVRDALDTSAAILVIISPASLKSHWVPYEIGHAAASHTIVLPYLTHPSLEVPDYIRDLNYTTSVEQVTQYFNDQFHDELNTNDTDLHRSLFDGGVKQIYPDRKDTIAQFQEQCESAKEIDIMGVCIPQLISSYSYFSEISARSKIRIVLLDPDAEIFRNCLGWFFDELDPSLAKIAEGSVERFANLAQLGAEIYKSSFWPMASVMRADDIMFYSPYVFRRRGADSPTFRLQRQDSGLFDVVLKGFEDAIAEAERVKTTKARRKRGPKPT